MTFLVLDCIRTLNEIREMTVDLIKETQLGDNDNFAQPNQGSTDNFPQAN